MSVQIVFEVTDEINAMFQLSSLLLGIDKNAMFEKMVRDFSSSIINNSNCDIGNINLKSQKVSSGSIERVEDYTAYPNKALHRIRLWARKPNQINHQCISAFLMCEKNGEASYNEMLDYFVNNTQFSKYQFYTNMTSMTTDAGNSHGRVFEIVGDSVILVKEVKNELNKYIKYFEN